MWKFLILFLIATPCLGQTEYPALYDVIGVAADDVLNVREAPYATSTIIGTLPADAKNVEILGKSENWGLVNVGERAGWTSMRYLEAHPGHDTLSHIERPLMCSGTEPFWSFTHTPNAPARFQAMGEEVLDLQTPVPVMPSGRIPVETALVTTGDAIRMTGFVKVEYCSDGMSDRAFGLSLNLLVEPDDASPYLLQGCCSLVTP